MSQLPRLPRFPMCRMELTLTHLRLCCRDFLQYVLSNRVHCITLYAWLDMGFSVEAAGTTTELQLFYLFILLPLTVYTVFLLFFFKPVNLKNTNILHAFKACLPCKVQRDESTKTPTGERRWGADLNVFTMILLRGWDKTFLPVTKNWNSWVLFK